MINIKQIVFFLLLIWMGIQIQALPTRYRPQFSTAGFYELPETGRSVYSMNQAWRFYKGDVPILPIANNYDDSQWSVVSLPHGIEYLPVNASGCVNYQGVTWYRKHFTPEEELKWKQLFLHFEAIMGKSKIWINGKLASEHYGGFNPHIVDITHLLQWGEDNVITVMADNSDDPLYPVGKPQDMLDFTYFGGIYRDCWLVAHNDVYITNANYENEVAGGGVFVSYNNVSEQRAEIVLKTHIRNNSSTNIMADVVINLRSLDEKLIQSVSKKSKIFKGNASSNVQKLVVQNPNLWSPEHPNLYYIDVLVKNEKGIVVDGYRQRIGIRSIEFKNLDGLWINGKPYSGKIMGTNRHQDFAILGNAVPNNLQWRDAKKLRDAGMKVVRPHYVVDPAFMDACDELGLFCLVAVPGWQFWNNESIFEQRVYNDIRNMIRIHRNHACLFFWEPILNETYYPDDFAKNARKICDEEYPYPYSVASCDDGAGGDQYFDLLLRPRMDKLLPDKTYFVREWGDNVDDWNAQNSNSRVARNWGEVPMLIQARHYEDWYQRNLKNPKQIIGGCFWHSFDHQRGYHSDPFYGGMMDAFRQPKTSYYMFMSQREKEKQNLLAESGPMIYIAHDMTPFSPVDVTVFSNCDEVRLTVFEKGKQYTLKGEQNDGALSHTFVFKNVFDFMATKQLARANKQNGYYLLAEGLIKGKVVVSDKRYPSGQTDHVRLRLDNENVPLVADGSDVVTIIAELVDKRGVVKRLTNNSIMFSIEGEGRLIGDESIGANPVPLMWGSAPVLVQSTPRVGKIKVKAEVCYPGSRRPTEGYLEFETVPNAQKEICSPQELQKMNSCVPKIVQPVSGFIVNICDELQIENAKLRRQLNDLRVKEVEKQQTEFGVGIND